MRGRNKRDQQWDNQQGYTGESYGYGEQNYADTGNGPYDDYNGYGGYNGGYDDDAMYAEDDGDRGWAGQVSGRKVRYAVCTERGAEMLNCEGLIAGALQDGS